MSQNTSPPMMESDPSTHLPPIICSRYPANETEKQSNQPALVAKDEPVTEPTPIKTSKDDARKEPVPTSTSTTSDSSSAPLRSQSRTMFTNAEGQPVNGSTFIGGAATTGPNSTAENNDFDRRAASADASLTPKQRSRIEKAEGKEGKRLAKIIKEEAKSEKKALSVAITELAELQKLQKQAIKVEEKTRSSQTKAMSQFQEAEHAFLAARTKYEAAQAHLHSEEEALERVRKNARDVTERLQQKSQEVDGLRTTYAVDERERATRLAELAEHSNHCF